MRDLEGVLLSLLRREMTHPIRQRLRSNGDTQTRLAHHSQEHAEASCLQSVEGAHRRP